MASWYGYAWWEWQHLEEFYELKCISWIIKLIEPLDERRDNDQENKSFLSCNQTLRDECWSIKLDENMNQSWIMFWDIADFSSINLDEFWCQIGEDLVVICGLTSSSSGLWMMKWSSSADSKVSTSNANSVNEFWNLQMRISLRDFILPWRTHWTFYHSRLNPNKDVMRASARVPSRLAL